MKVLVVPDIHLKKWMFARAGEMLDQGIAKRAVILGDLVDEFDQQFNVDLYIQTLDAAIDFAKRYPDTLWCIGNHDYSYEQAFPESGYSSFVSSYVCMRLAKLREHAKLLFVNRIDQVLFSHAGISERFVRRMISKDENEGVDRIIEKINALEPEEIWQNDSPIWLRPQHSRCKMYAADSMLQVVGHTPIKTITRKNNVISADVFSLDYPSKNPYGSEEFLLLDTKTWEYQGVK